MSKSKGNVIKPWDILNKQGADALRWYFFTVVSPWNSKNFSVKTVDEVIRKFILTLWNVYSFFVIYANIDDFDPYRYELAVKDRIEIDRWIISELNKTIKKVTELMDDYNVTDSGRLIESFVDDLSNWYVRRSRRRFWKGENDREKISAYKTLYECLLAVTKLSAPYIPFISDELNWKIKSAFQSEGIRVRFYHNNKSLRSILTKKSPHQVCTTPTCKFKTTGLCFTNHVVYQVTCNTCHLSYIGSTIRLLHTRLGEHLRDNNSSIFKHIQNCVDETIDGLNGKLNVKILAFENDAVNLRIKEAFLIRQRFPRLNSREEMRTMELLI